MSHFLNMKKMLGLRLGLCLGLGLNLGLGLGLGLGLVKKMYVTFS